MASIFSIFSDEKGMKGSIATATLAVICNAMFSMVFTRSGSVLTTFHGSVSARYLLPMRAKFMAFLSASRKRKFSMLDSSSERMP